MRGSGYRRMIEHLKFGTRAFRMVKDSSATDTG
jgi:hypothetical protein